MKCYFEQTNQSHCAQKRTGFSVIISTAKLAQVNNVTNFDSNTFLKDYWQKQPCLIRQFFPQFEDIIDEHELAGLAMEPELDSRIVRYYEDSWQVIQGPFAHFEQCKGLWSLLVQGVDKVLPDAADMMAPFSFIPYWRMDDLMISFAVPEAGVGPHIDQYDVFLIQGKGSRRWRVGKPDIATERISAPGLRQVDAFEPVIDCKLLPGDVLYIPPGWPHDGKAISPCITYSVGFRAPEQSQLTGYLAEHFANHCESTRFSDPQRQPQSNPVWVSEQDTSAIKQLIHEAVDSPAFLNTLLMLLSEQSVEPMPPDEVFTDAITLETFEHNEPLYRLTGLRPVLHPKLTQLLFINGEKVEHSCTDSTVLAELLSKTVVYLTDFDSHPCKLDIISAFTTLINMGYYNFSSE